MTALGGKHTQEARNKQRLAKFKNPVRYWKGKKRGPPSEETRRKMSAAHKGHGHTEQTRLAMREARLGEKGSNWKGGVYPLNKALRKSTMSKMWREAVFKRDNYTCQRCGARGVELNADHIKPFAYYPDQRFDVSNGRTLCVPCHRNTDTFGSRISTRYGNH